MTENDTLRMVITDNKINGEVAAKYLNIYVGFMDWDLPLRKLYVSPKINKDEEEFKQIICATILLPSVDKSVRIDPEHPDNLLLKMPYFQQVGGRDWFKDFQKVVDEDIKHDHQRRQAYVLGVVTPFEYSPITRQAYNWLYTKAEESGVITSPEIKEDISERFKNLVMAYGGAVICNIFSRHEGALKKVVNWRTGYFFEKIIYETYSMDQILKIKKSELKETNEKLVKSVRII